MKKSNFLKRVISALLMLVLAASMFSASAAGETGATKRLVQLPGNYTNIVGYSDDLVFCAKSFNDTVKYGAVDYRGRIVIPFEMDDIRLSGSADGRYIGYYYNETYDYYESVFFNKDGSVLKAADDNMYYNYYSDNILTYYQWDENIEKVVFSRYDENYTDSEIVSFDVNTDLYESSISRDGWIIFTNGNTVKFCKADDPQVNTKSFADGDAVVIMSLDDGKAILMSVSAEIESSKMYLLDLNSGIAGEILTSFDLNRVGLLPYINGNYNSCNTGSVVSIFDTIDGTTLLYDVEKNTTILRGYQYISPNLNEKWVLVVKDDTPGYNDLKGNEFIRYVDATEFFDGTAVVCDDDGYYVVNENLEPVSAKGYSFTSLVSLSDKIVLDQGSNGYSIIVITDDPDFSAMGDVDGNDKVNVSDVVTLRQTIMANNVNDKLIYAADFDGNNQLNVSDVVALRQTIIG